MRLLAVDPSIEEMGVAVWDLDFQTVDVCDTLHQQGTDGERLVQIARRLRELCREWEPDAAVVEVPTSLYVERGRSQTVLKVLLAVGAAVGSICNCVTEIGLVSVKDWRGTIKLRAPKETALVVAQALGHDVRTHHEAEAILIGAHFINPLGLKAMLVLAGYGRTDRDELLAAFDKYRRAVLLDQVFGAIRATDTRAQLKAKGGKRGSTGMA